MRPAVRLFFRAVRLFLQPILMLVDWVTTPKGIERSPDAQSKMDARTESLSLYQFKTCPFCVKVRRQMKRQSLNVQILDAQHNDQSRKELLAGGGAVRVPCLRVAGEGNEVTWMYESDDIVAYLQENFA